jgi:uncharacterized protein YgiM (DUF1202 family)
MSRKVVMVLFGLLLLSAALPAFAQESGFIVSASRVNLRSGPGAGYPVVTVLATGQQFTLLSRNVDGSWVQAQLITGVTGWVNARFVSTAAAVPTLGVSQNTGRNNATVWAHFLNVRSGPGANFEIVGKLNQGQGMDLLGRNLDSTWAQIQVPGGVNGWISARYIASSVRIDNLPVTSNTGILPTLPQPQSGSGKTGIVTAIGLNVRFGPGLGYRYFDRLAQGESVSLIGRNAAGNWLLVQQANGSTGWINSGFVSTGFPIFSLDIRG